MILSDTERLNWVLDILSLTDADHSKIDAKTNAVASVLLQNMQGREGLDKAMEIYQEMIAKR